MIEVRKKRSNYAFILLMASVPIYLIIVVLILLLNKVTRLGIDIFALTFLFTGFLSFSFGLFIYSQNRQDFLNRTWMVFSFFLSIWSFSFGMSALSQDEATALFWVKMLHIGGIGIPIFYMHFIFTFLGKIASRSYKRLVIGSYLLGLVLLFFNLFTSLFVGVQPILSFRYYTVAKSEVYSLYVLMFIGCVGFALYELFKDWAKTSGIKRNQILYIILASCIGFSAGLTVFFPVFNMEIFPYGIYFIPIYILIMGYAIAKYRLMDINIVARKGLTYGLLLFLILAPSSLILFLAQQAYFGSISYPFSLLFLFIAGLIAVVFSQAKISIEQQILKLFFRSRYNSYMILTDFTKSLVSILDLQELLDKLIHTFVKVMGIQKVSMFLSDKAREHYHLAASHGLDEEAFKRITIGTRDPFPTWLRQSSDVVIKEELEDQAADPMVKAVIDQMNELETELCIPLLSRRRLIGFCSLGHKTSGKMYSHEDLELLSNLARQAAVAIENARLYEEERKDAARLSAVLATTTAINSQLESEAVLQMVIEKAINVLEAETGILYILDEASRLLVPAAWHKLSIRPEELILRIGESASGQAVSQNRPIVIPDVEADPERRVNLELARREGVWAVLSVPLSIKGKAIGAMVVHRSVPHHFSEDEITTLTLFAYQAAIAIENARLFRELREAYEDLQRTQAALVEAERQEAITALAGAAAHELNQPLSTITISSDLLLRNMDQEDPRRQKLETIAREVERMAEIVGKISRIIRYETKPYMGDRKIVDLERSAEESSS